LGFGILFFGMKLMSDAMAPLRSYPDFIDMMKSLENPFMGILAGALFTAVVQSSSATTGVVIVLAQQGLITLEAGIAIVLGANIGTCVTAGLASIGTQREAKRVALAHVLFKIVGVLIILPFIQPFADMIRTFTEQFGSGTARQIANAHTVFNVGIALLFLPFIDLFASLILRILPNKPREKGLDPATWHLDDKIISTPAIALQLATAEIARMAKILSRMHRAAMIPFVVDDPQRDEIYPQQLTLQQGIEMRKNKIDFLDARIRRYLLDISRHKLGTGQGSEVSGLLSLLDSMERISEVVTTQIVPLIKKKEELGIDFSEEGKKELIDYHKKVGKQLERLRQMISEMDASVAEKVTKKRDRYASFDSRLRRHHLERMLAMKEASVETHSIHMELMDAMNHINIYSAEIADTLLQSGALVEAKDKDKDKSAEIVVESHAK
jgi:phosphate:Na+ symporter